MLYNAAERPGRLRKELKDKICWQVLRDNPKYATEYSIQVKSLSRSWENTLEEKEETKE